MKSIILKYLSGKSTESEQKELLEWLRDKDNSTEFQSIKKDWKSKVSHEDVPQEMRQDWKKIEHQIYSTIQSDLKQKQRALNFFRYAAAIVLLVTIPSLIYFYSQQKSSSLSYTTVAADFGQISKVVLPDSTVIWINSGSTIKYNNQFSNENRDVELLGEAFFEVTKNKDLPFVVSSEDLHVKVLGTEFCVTAYPEEKNIQIVLEKGKINLTSTNHASFNQDMNPGEMATFDKAKKELKISHVNTGLYTSWRDGIINIYNLPLSELVLKLEKRYNQKFIVDEEIKHLPYTFTIKTENLNNILSLMEKITPLDAVQKGNVIELRYNRLKTKMK